MAQASTLTALELAWLAERVGTLPGGWSLEPVAGPGDLSAVLLPAEGDRFAPSFLIDRAAPGYRVMACRWDRMSPAGVFPSLDAAFASIAAAAATAMQGAPFPNLQ